MSKIGNRGYVPEDVRQFTGAELVKLKKAAGEVKYLLDQGYPVKMTTTFVGNHYMFSERQRLALARAVSATEDVRQRSAKELLHQQESSGAIMMDTVYIDGFNTIITLEVALSGSLVLLSEDGTLRDLAGLRGTYRIIDKTEAAVRLIMKRLDDIQIQKAIFYLDAPVSNSGRLKTLIMECSTDFKVVIDVMLMNDVDRALEKLSGVISTDAIILNKCESWLNFLPGIVNDLENVWCVEL